MTYTVNFMLKKIAKKSTTSCSIDLLTITIYT